MKTALLFIVITFLQNQSHACSMSEKQNKKIVTQFYKTVFIDHNVQKAVDLYMGEKYTQHNPRVPDGPKAFSEFFIPYFKDHPEARAEIKRVVADDDIVMLHVHAKTNAADRGRAIVDIFRVADGKVVEHWDVIQEIPEKSANNHTMF